MASLNFPDSPVVGDLYTAPTGVQYQWDGSAWLVVSAAVGMPGPQGEVGPEGPPGPAGADGAAGPAGADGKNGLPGKEGAEGPVGPTGPQGPAGMGINLKGHVPTEADLPTGALQGDTYVVDATGNAWSWSDADATYLDIGKIVGPQGATGPQGPAGADGSAGPAGADGKNGLPGKDGVDGAVGPQGPAGETGAVGPAGPQGEQGIPGEMGSVGPKGEKGDQGEQGLTGTDGPKGDTGAVGPAGAQGEAGPQGPAGADGAAGPQGEVGPKGDTGATGPKGDQGDQGIPGLGIVFQGRVATVGDLPATAAQGDMYIVSETGDAWVWADDAGAFENAGPIVGPKGDQGPQGAQGEPGVAGPKGDVGETGPAGAEGVQGPVGPAGPTAVSKDANNTATLGTDGLLYVGASAYTLPIATASRLGGVKIGTGMTVTADGTISTTASTNYVNKNGDVINGALRYSDMGGVSSFNGSDVYTYYGGGVYRIHMPGGKSGIMIEAATAKVTFAAVPKCAFSPTDSTDLVNKSYVDSAIGGGAYLPLAGGTMTGGITLPTTVQSLTFGTSTYNVFGASGGVAIRYGNSNIVNFTATTATFTQKITTPATGLGLEFGSGGGYLSKVGTGFGFYAGGQQRFKVDDVLHTSLVPIKLPADPTDPLHAATKQYVDSKAGASIVSIADGATEPAASGYPEGALLVRYTP